MEWLSKLIGSSGKDLMEGTGELLKDIRTALTGETPLDPNKAAELKMKMEAYEFALQRLAIDFDKAAMQGQVAINLEEAKSESLYKSGWRPFVGWTCGIGFFIQLVFSPIGVWITKIVTGNAIEFPEMNTEIMVTTLFGLLGLGGMRTYEKTKKGG